MPKAAWVGIPADQKLIGHHYFHAVGEKYLRAVWEASDCMPMLIPSIQPALPWRELLSQLDGLFLTGAYSNIEPHHYSDEPSYEGNEHDPARDANTLPLIPLALEMNVPIFAVCRGFQEVNVALGGSLYQKVHQTPGYNNHLEDPNDPLDQQYALSHPVRIAEGGVLHSLGYSGDVMVNSLHGQGIRALAPSLKVEATAPDGLIEAVSTTRSDRFLLAVQWHPEWKVRENEFYLSMFRLFGDKCRQRQKARAELVPA
jgi:putative glutamine amidotransferase